MTALNDIELDNRLLRDYLDGLVNRFFKILPMWEEGETPVRPYIASLQREMLGCGGVLTAIRFDGRYLSLVTTMQYFVEHPEADVAAVRTEVFRAINMLKKLKAAYCAEGDEASGRLGCLRQQDDDDRTDQAGDVGKAHP